MGLGSFGIPGAPQVSENGIGFVWYPLGARERPEAGLGSFRIVVGHERERR